MVRLFPATRLQMVNRWWAGAAAMSLLCACAERRMPTDAMHWRRVYWAGPMGAAVVGPMLHDVWFPPVGSEGDTGQPDLRPAPRATAQPQYDESDFSNGGRMDSLEVRLDMPRHLACYGHVGPHPAGMSWYSDTLAYVHRRFTWTTAEEFNANAGTVQLGFLAQCRRQPSPFLQLAETCARRTL